MDSADSSNKVPANSLRKTELLFMIIWFWIDVASLQVSFLSQLQIVKHANSFNWNIPKDPVVTIQKIIFISLQVTGRDSKHFSDIPYVM